MAENYSVVDFSGLSATSDGNTLLYANNQVCKSDKTLGQLIDGKIEDKGYASETYVDASIETLSGTVDQNFATKEDIGKIGNFIVTTGDEEGPTLDPSEAETKSIYLIKDESVTGADQYKEWIVTEKDDTKQWSCIGDTSVELSGYALSADVEAALNLKEDKLTFTYDNDVITAINNSAVGQVLDAGTDISIDNGIVSVNTNGSSRGQYSFVEGMNTFAADIADHVEGIGGIAEQGGCNHIEGFQYHTYTSNGPASDYYGTNKVKFYNALSFTVAGGTINGSLYELVKAFKDRFIVSCEYSSQTEYHYASQSFFKPKLYNIIDVRLIEETNYIELTIDGEIDCKSGGAIYLCGPNSLTSINGGGGSIIQGQAISTFTFNGLGFPGNNQENVRPDNCFFAFTIIYTPSGSSETTNFYRIIKPSSITYDSSTNVYTFEMEDSISLPSDVQSGSYGFAIYLLNSDYYGCNHIEGMDNVIKGAAYSHAEGSNNYINGSYAHAEGNGTSAQGNYSHTEGQNTIAAGTESHAEGQSTSAQGNYSHTEGYSTLATNGQASYKNAEHAEGYQTSAIGRGSHSEGSNTIASADGGQCHAEGYQTSAMGDHAHTEGANTYATGSNSHAEGNNTQAIGDNSHAEGGWTTATNNCSHAEGSYTLANGSYSHAEGYDTIAGTESMHVGGKYNSTSANAAFVIGNGTSHNNRSDAFIVDWNGVASATKLSTSGIQDVEEAIKNAGGGINLVWKTDQQTINYKFDDFVDAIQNKKSINLYVVDEYDDTRVMAVVNQFTDITDPDPQSQMGKMYEAFVIAQKYSYGEMTDQSSLILLGEDPSTNNIRIMAQQLLYVDVPNPSYNSVPSGYVLTYSGDNKMVWSAAGGGSTLVAGTDLVIDNGTIKVNTNGITSGTYAFVEGSATSAIGNYSHAEGYYSKALGECAHAEGATAYASGYAAHAEGVYTTAMGDYSHSEGNRTLASGYAAHAEGRETTAMGNYSHAEGRETKAIGANSHAAGFGTQATRADSFVCGSYNVSNSNAHFIVGNGTNDANKNNAFVVYSQNNFPNLPIGVASATKLATSGISDIETEINSLRNSYNELYNSYTALSSTFATYSGQWLIGTSN